MADELQSLSKLFSERIFRIPDYQRGYAWQQPQLIDFWEDLINLTDGRYHYTGMLSLKQLTNKDVESWGTDKWMVKENDFKPFHVVDGQQRLTTFVILLHEIVCFVRGLEENRGKRDEEIYIGNGNLKEIVKKYICQSRPPKHITTTYLFGYEADNPSAEYLRFKVFNEKNAGSVQETYYTKNLKNTKEFFKENIKAYYDNYGFDGITQIYRNLTQRLMFNIHIINDDYDVFVAFETMNNRGKRLTNLELLKNRLIYLTTIYGKNELDDFDRDELRKKINDAWKEVYYQLGRNQQSPLSDDDFLRAHWILCFPYSRNRGDDYIRFLLSKFSPKNVYTKQTVVRSEPDSLEEVIDDQVVDEEDQITDFPEPEVKDSAQLDPNEIRDYVLRLKDAAKFWYDTFFPYENTTLTDKEKIWIDRLNRIGIGYFRPMVMAALSISATPDERINLFHAIERYIFICFRLGNFQATYRSSEYYRATRSLYLGERSIADITKGINETVNRDVEFALPSLITRIEKRFSSGLGYYQWGPLKYILYEYEYNLAEKLNAAKKISWELFTKSEKDKVTIEHILPQDPSKYYWQNMFRQYSPEEKRTLSGAIGNLLPLSQSVNSSLQNVSFEDKKHSTENGRRGYENGSHSEIEVSKESDWDANRIFKRSCQLLSFMESRWGFSLTEGQKGKLVFVNFVNDGRPVPSSIDEASFVEKAETDQLDTGEVRLSYWEYALPIIRGQLIVNGKGPFSNASAMKSVEQVGEFEIEGIRLCCSIKLRPKQASVDLRIDSRKIYGVLEAHREEIESKFTIPFEWIANDQEHSYSISARSDGDFRNQSEWPTLSAFQEKACNELTQYAFYPYEDEIRDALNG